MAKNITVTLTPAQQRDLIWAINTFDSSFDGGCGFDDIDKAQAQAMRNLARLYYSCSN